MAQKKLKWINMFRLSVAFILLFTGFVKCLSALGTSHILTMADPFFGITFRKEFWIIGTLEILIAVACFVCNRGFFHAWLICWLGTFLFVYRIGLALIGYHRPCSCLGNFTDVLHVSPQIADAIMKAILAYFLFGSYSILLWAWREKRTMTSMTDSLRQ